MTVIAVIGANGRVGSEVCLLLSLMDGVQVIPIVRSAYATSYLKRLGLSCRIGSVSDTTNARDLLSGADVIADFSLPRGTRSAVEQALRGKVKSVLHNAPSGAVYVFASTTMAYGIDKHLVYQDHLVARTPYAASKRYGERLAIAQGKALDHPVYVFRLGEVHGELQTCSRDILEAFDGRRIALPHAGEVASDVVFCSTIALALTHLGDRTPAGTYTLVESPTWSLRRLYEEYARVLGQGVTFEDSGSAPSALRQALSLARGLVISNKEMLVAQLLPAIPRLEQRARGPWLAHSATAQIAQGRAREVYAPSHRSGDVPGQRIARLEGSYEAAARIRQELRKRLHERFGRDGHVFES